MSQTLPLPPSHEPKNRRSRRPLSQRIVRRTWSRITPKRAHSRPTIVRRISEFVHVCLIGALVGAAGGVVFTAARYVWALM
jgi:hypothetical protein